MTCMFQCSSLKWERVAAIEIIDILNIEERYNAMEQFRIKLKLAQVTVSKGLYDNIQGVPK